MAEKINLVADFTEPFIEDNSWNRTKQVNIEAFSLKGYSRGVLKTISYVPPCNWSHEVVKKINENMVQTFNFYKEFDDNFKNYKLEHCFIKR